MGCERRGMSEFYVPARRTVQPLGPVDLDTSRNATAERVGQLLSASTDLDGLGVTPRESEVLAQVALRLTNVETADSCALSERTVESHMSSLLRKLGVTNRVALAGSPTGSSPGRPSRSTGCRPRWKLLADATTYVGRTAERARLHDLWLRACRGAHADRGPRRRGGHRQEPAGRRAGRPGPRPGAQVMLGACFEELPLSYPRSSRRWPTTPPGSDRELGRRLLQADAWARLVPAMASRASRWPPTPALFEQAAAQGEVLAGLQTYLGRAAEDGPVLLVIGGPALGDLTTLHRSGTSRAARRRVGADPGRGHHRDAPPDLDDTLALFLSICPHADGRPEPYLSGGSVTTTSPRCWDRRPTRIRPLTDSGAIRC